jgi:ATP-dependent exoDNAse (exonuclease V) beta subunit
VPALDYAALNRERLEREDAEERRLLYVAMTRAEETLILSGGFDLARRPEPRHGGAPIAWILRALEGVVEPRRNDPGALPAPEVAPPRPAGTALPAPATLAAAAPPPAVAGAAAPTRLSFSSLGEYGQCPYRWYLGRVLGLPRVKPPAPIGAEPQVVLAPGAPEPETEGLDPLTRGSLVHALLEDLDFARPAAPDAEAVAAAAARADVELTPEEAADVTRLVVAFADSSLCGRLAAARVVRREARFAFALDRSARSLLVNGVVDVLATEADGAALVVDYKTNPLGESDPEQITRHDYGAQRLVYALAALRDGAPTVEVAHCFLERPDQPATATYAAADAPALTEQLVELSRGLLAGDFTPTAAPHYELCGSCPGRRALCSHPEELTLRPYVDLHAA